MSDLPDLDLLETFLTVAEHSSISEAARALELTQPAITKKIKRLEAFVDVELIDRHARPLQVTEAGAILLDRAPELLRNARSVVGTLRSMSKSGMPVLRLGMSDTLSAILGAEFVGAAQRFAHTVELKSGISPWLDTAFRARHFDFSIDSAPFGDTANLGMHPLFYDPFVVILPKEMANRTLEDIARTENHVGYGRSSKFGAYVSELTSAVGAARQPRFNFDSTQSLVRFVQAGYGWAITSAFCLIQVPHALRDMTALPAPGSVPRHFHLLHRLGEHDAIAEGLAGKFREVFGQLTDGPWRQLAPDAVEMIAEANT